jgi:MFS transporter, DHA2 family, multidrug resistance protein
MSDSRPFSTGRAMINPELADKLDRFQATLHARLQAITAFEKFMIVIGVGQASCMELGTTTSVNVILPDMQGSVGASADQISWAITIYSAAFLCSLPLSPWLARRCGHRSHLLLSIALYSLGALGCALSHELWMLLFSRAIMGIGGGPLLVRSMTTIYQLVQGKARGKYLFLFGTVLLGSKMLLPLVFGAVTDWITWNAAFLVIIPIALSSAALIRLFMPRDMHFEAEPPRPDFAGIAFLVASVAAFQIIASRGEQDNWFGALHLRVAFVIGFLALSAFTFRDGDLKNPNPLLNLRLIIAQRALSSGFGIAIILGAILGSGLYVLPQYLRTIQTYSATQTGTFLFVDGLAGLCGYFVFTRLLPFVGAFYLNLAALTLFIFGNFVFVHVLTSETPSPQICIFLTFHGVSTGMLLGGIGMLILPQIDLQFISFGTAIYLSLRNIGTSLGVSSVVAYLDIRQTVHSSRLLDTANRLNPRVGVTTSLLSALLHIRGLSVNSSSIGANQLLSGLVNTQARLLAFIDVFWALQILGLAGIVLLLIWRGTSSGRP